MAAVRRPRPRAHAGRDPAVFVRPGTFDITRPPGPRLAFGHGPRLTFGHGPHRCIGADLAPLELRTAIGALADRAPHLRLAEPDTGLGLPFLGGSLIGGVGRRPVRTHPPDPRRRAAWTPADRRRGPDRPAPGSGRAMSVPWNDPAIAAQRPGPTESSRLRWSQGREGDGAGVRRRGRNCCGSTSPTRT
ncbi:cytochrome P450 [Kitasatospora purpeofusca]|uniref:cytochrome P450 n=1 Tax=Kitasatospora purpeofusca TaxID=67352 RepID=UPI0033FFFACE